MQRGQPFGSPITPQQAVAKAVAALSPSYGPALPELRRAALTSDDPELPDVELELRKERRLYSRSWSLVIEARVAATGPAGPFALRYRRRPFRRATGLEAVGSASRRDADAWARRFEDAGLVRGAEEMTSVQDLSVSWRPEDRAWGLRLQTLAGSLIGTAPGSSIAVPFEPADVSGLLRLLRAFRTAVATLR